MIVAELIERLRACDPTAEVLCVCPYGEGPVPATVRAGRALHVAGASYREWTVEDPTFQSLEDEESYRRAVDEPVGERRSIVLIGTART